MLLTPIVRSAEWSIAEKLKKAFAETLGTTVIPLFKPKLSLIIGPTCEFDGAGLDCRAEILVCVDRKSVPRNSQLDRIARATDPYSQLIVLAAVLIHGHASEEEHLAAREIAEFHGLPCVNVSPDASPEQVVGAARKVSLSEVEAFHRRRGRWRRVVNDWHNDLLGEISARTSLFGLGCVVEPSLDAIIDLSAAQKAGLLSTAAHKGSIDLAEAEIYFRQTAADLVVTTPGPLCVPVLVLHVDGKYHSESQQQKQDVACDELLRSAGLLVCRAQLDTIGKHGQPSRKDGQGTLLYWQRVQDLATVVLNMARELASPIKQPRIWEKLLADGLHRVAQYDRYLAEDLTFLIGQTLTSVGERISEVQRAYDDLLMVTEPEAESFTDEQYEAANVSIVDRMQEDLRSGDIGMLFSLLRKENLSDAAGHPSALRVLHPDSSNEPLVEVQRPWPNVLSFRGKHHARAKKMFERLTSTRLETDAMSQVAALPSGVINTLAERYVVELGRQREEMQQAGWNRLSIDEREKRIKDELSPSVWWMGRTRLEFHQDKSAADILRALQEPPPRRDCFAEIRSAQDVDDVLAALRDRRRHLLALISRDDRQDDDRAYLELVVADEYERHLTRLEECRRRSENQGL